MVSAGAMQNKKKFYKSKNRYQLNKIINTIITPAIETPSYIESKITCFNKQFAYVSVPSDGGPVEGGTELEVAKLDIRAAIKQALHDGVVTL